MRSLTIMNYDYNRDYYEDYEVQTFEDVSKLSYNIFKAICDIRNMRIDLNRCIKDYDVKKHINDFIEQLDLDELYGFIYRKLWRAADSETKSQYDVLFKLLDGNHVKTVLAIQTGLMQEILKGNNNASR